MSRLNKSSKFEHEDYYFGEPKSLKATFRKWAKELELIERAPAPGVIEVFGEGGYDAFSEKCRVARANFTKAANRLLVYFCSTCRGYKRFPTRIGKHWKYNWNPKQPQSDVSRIIDADNRVDRSKYSLLTRYRLKMKKGSEVLVYLDLYSRESGIENLRLCVHGIELDTTAMPFSEVAKFLCVDTPDEDAPSEVERLLANHLLMKMSH